MVSEVFGSIDSAASLPLALSQAYALGVYDHQHSRESQRIGTIHYIEQMVGAGALTREAGVVLAYTLGTQDAAVADVALDVVDIALQASGDDDT